MGISSNRQLPKGRWAFTVLFFEGAGEVGLVIKPDFVADFGDRFIGLIEKFGRALQPHGSDKISGRLAHQGVQFSVELRDTHVQ